MQSIQNPDRHARLDSEINDLASAWQQAMLAPVPSIRRLLAQCPAYRTTPLITLPRDVLSPAQSAPALWLKVETARMDLGSFKALGGVYAVLRVVAAYVSRQIGRTVSIEEIMQGHWRETAARLTVCCASAGNHGLAVASGAQLAGCRCIVFLASSVPASFEQRLTAAQALVRRTGTTYEHAMAAAATAAQQEDLVLVADSSWPGYTDIPLDVMAGYGVIVAETIEQLTTAHVVPTHVLIQAGVGGLAAAVAAAMRKHYGDALKIIVVEPEAAPCLRESVCAGRMLRVEGPTSSMGRLDCKEASLIAYILLRTLCDTWVSVEDAEAETGCAAISPWVSTTPSGAAGLAALSAACAHPEIAAQWQMDAHSQVLAFVTEKN